jgi:hypothetical protein
MIPESSKAHLEFEIRPNEPYQYKTNEVIKAKLKASKQSQKCFTVILTAFKKYLSDKILLILKRLNFE